MNKKYALVIVLLTIGFVFHSASADTSIPSWIKSNAKYWKEGQIGDDDYVKGMQFLITNGVIQVPSSDESVEKSSKIPSWVKNAAGYWADGSLGDSEYVSSMQYLIGAGIIDVSKESISSISVQSSTLNDTSKATSSTTTSSDGEMLKCDSALTPADKQTCLQELQAEMDIKAKIAKATPLVVGPVTYYIVSSDLINTGDGGVFINVHTVLENTGSASSNPDLFCTGPYACNYHLTDGQADYPPSIFSLTSGHLELRYHKPVAVDWDFYSKENIGGFTYDSSKTYSFKVSESFGSGSIKLKLVTQ
jgi:hypothetical protein